MTIKKLDWFIYGNRGNNLLVLLAVAGAAAIAAMAIGLTLALYPP